MTSSQQIVAFCAADPRSPCYIVNHRQPLFRMDVQPLRLRFLSNRLLHPTNALMYRAALIESSSITLPSRFVASEGLVSIMTIYFFSNSACSSPQIWFSFNFLPSILLISAFWIAFPSHTTVFPLCHCSLALPHRIFSTLWLIAFRAV